MEIFEGNKEIFKNLKIITEHNLDFDKIHSKVIRLIIPCLENVERLERDLII